MISKKTAKENDPTFARKMLIAANLTGVQADIDYAYQALIIAYGKIPHRTPEQAGQNATQDLDKIIEAMQLVDKAAEKDSGLQTKRRENMRLPSVTLKG